MTRPAKPRPLADLLADAHRELAAARAQIDRAVAIVRRLRRELDATWVGPAYGELVEWQRENEAAP